MSCKVVRTGDAVTVLDNFGKPSKLYQQALERTSNTDEALSIWAVTQTEDWVDMFGETKESNLDEVLRYLSSMDNQSTLDKGELQEVQMIMKDLGLDSVFAFTNKLNKLFQPNGYFEIDNNRLIDSGLYTQDDIDSLNEVNVKRLLSKLNTYNLDFEVLNNNDRILPLSANFKDTRAKRTIFGTKPMVNEQDIIKIVADQAKGDFSKKSIIKALANTEFASLIDSKSAVSSLVEYLADKRLITNQFFNGVEYTSDNLTTFTTVKNTILENVDTVEIEESLDFIKSIDSEVWDNNKDNVKQILKEITEDLAKSNIDVVGLENIFGNKQAIVDLLTATQDMLDNPSQENVLAFSQIKDALIKPDNNTTLEQVNSRFDGLNVVRVNSEFSDSELFENSGLIKIDNTGLYHKVNRATKEELYDAVYEGYVNNTINIDPKYFETEFPKDLENQASTREGIRTFIQSRDIGFNSPLAEEISLNQVAFGHPNLKSDGLIAQPSENADYLKQGFVSDFYNYQLKEKLANSPLYNKVLKYFSITDNDITLNNPNVRIGGTKYETGLKEYANIKKNGLIKTLAEFNNNVDEDLKALNNPKSVNTVQGVSLIKDGDYLVTSPNADLYTKVGDKVYRKLLDSLEGTIYGEVRIEPDNIYFDTNTNFSFNEAEARAVLNRNTKNIEPKLAEDSKELKDKIHVSNVIETPTSNTETNSLQKAIQRNNGNPLNLAPNGKPSILYQSYKDLGYSNTEAENLTAQVYSDNFVAWFGDWVNNPQDASKVVDSNGQPLVVFHGTKETFNEFSTEYGKYTDGTFFSTKLGTASIYGDTRPFFIRASNVREVGSSLPGVYDMGDIRGTDFDGLWNKGTNEVVVGIANQIKSATENTGQFSNENNDIRYQIISEKGASQVLEYKESLDEAKKMHTQGVPLSEIENKTKWYLFKDNWRRVSPETIRDFKIKDNTINKVLTLKDVLGNENVLFNFYPQLRETKVVFADTNLQNVPVQTPKDFEKSNGLFHEDSNTIVINTRNAKTQSQQEYTLSHEVAHNVQKLEGLPKGGGLASVLSETLDILNLEGNKPLPQIYQEIISADKSKLTINEKKIVQASIDTVSDLVLGRAGNLQSQYLHLMGEIDANIVEGAMNIRDNSGFIETSYSSLLNFYNESTNIDPDNILLLRNGNVRFNINESNKSAPKETVKEVINKLKETGLAEKVFELTSAEMEAKLVELGLDADIAKQVSVWHGSPHLFDKFSLSTIGLGEGAQAFGWGLYFTDLESIARNYAENEELITKHVEKQYEFGLPDRFLNIPVGLISKKTELIKYINKQIKGFEGNKYQQTEWQKLKDAVQSYDANTYKVSLHKGKQPSEYTWLEWDKSLTNEQKELLFNNVSEASLSGEIHDIKISDRFDADSFDGGKTYKVGDTSKMGEVDEFISTIYNTLEEAEVEALRLNYLDTYVTGKDLYEALAKEKGNKQASLFLLENGIDGIKYPAESISRGATSDTARGLNYVVFDENAVTIEEHIQFQKTLSKVGIGMTTNGFTYKNEVYLNTDLMTEETPIHEFNHLYTKWLKENNKEIYDKGISLITEELNKENSEIKDVIDFVKTNQPNLKGEKLKEEILTELVGRRGVEIIEENKDSAITNWLKNVWSKIKGMLGLSQFSASQVSKMNLGEYSRAMAVDLLSGEAIKGQQAQEYFTREADRLQLVQDIINTPNFMSMLEDLKIMEKIC